MSEQKEKIIIMFVGRTGDGKSSTANSMHRRLGYVGEACFGEGGGACAHTHNPKSETLGDFIIVDNPGLVDTEGAAQDQTNLIGMVNHAKTLEYVHLFALVVNFKSPRFDGAMQSAVKLIVDSFSPESLKHFCLVYTRCANLTKQRKETMMQNAADILVLINRRCNTSLKHLPVYYVDNHVEDLAEDDVPEASIARYRKAIEEQMDDMFTLARSLKAFSTKNAVFGEYDAAKAEREAKEAQAEAQRQIQAISQQMAAAEAKHNEEKRQLRTKAEKEKADIAYSTKVVACNKQRQRILINSTTSPKLQDVSVAFERPRRFWGAFGFTKTDHRMETKHTGNIVQRTYAVQERDVRVLGNGEERVGDWVTVDTQVEREDLGF